MNYIIFISDLFLANSKEVVGGSQADVGDFLLARRRVESKEIVLHELIDFHDCSLVAASVAVVRGGEYRDHVALMGPVVSIHNQLMGPCNSCEVIGVVELLRDVLTE